MKKVIVTFDNTNFSQSAMDFAIELNGLSPVLLTGVFLPQSQISAMWSYADGGLAGISIPTMEPVTATEVEKNVQNFKAICDRNGVEYRIHKDFRDFALQELVRESRFADLVLLGGNSFYQKATDQTPNEYLRQLLHDIESPVMLIPDKVKLPTSNILSYDGSANSVFAIKQFAYLFPQLTANETTLIYLNEKADKDLPEKENIKELVCRHFYDLEITHLPFDLKKYLATWINNRSGSILVAGAYGRSGISRMFASSAVNEVIANHKIPVFIAHK